MPGPFPGMDPYLESADLWQGTHNALITLMRGTLNAVLPPPYVARSEVRCYIEKRGESIRPDVFVSIARQRPAGFGSGGAAVAEPFSPSLQIHIEREERREAYLEIVNLQDSQRVVTTIELLSPTNKNTRDAGRRIYQEKQARLLASTTHLIEIDLLRAGTHTVSVPLLAFTSELTWDYLVCLHRAERDDDYEVWPIAVRDSLPLIKVPLDEGVPDAPLALQAIFDRNYDEGAYGYQIDYTQEPRPYLRKEDAIWADALLREKGLRPCAFDGDKQ